jgi:hypothetical protein
MIFAGNWSGLNSLYAGTADCWKPEEQSMKTIVLKAKEIGEIKARLATESAPLSCAALWDALPLQVNLSAWGDELYGTIAVDIDAENPREEFEVGDIAYWLQGSGFCILYGRTPASTSDKPRLISPGNHLARIDGDVSIFKGLRGLRLTVERGEEEGDD